MDLDFEKPLEEIDARIQELENLSNGAGKHFNSEISALKRKRKSLEKRVYTGLSAWQTVQVARHSERPGIGDYIKHMCSDFIELHGDRCFGDDRGIIGGLATIDDARVMLIGHQKGKTVEERIRANFGMGSPDGYRKALRLMRLAEKYRIPVVTLIDTPGAYPGMDAEARGQAEAIARNLTEMSTLETPIIVVITGEGGSGGALGIGVGDVILMLSNSVYSVISPEGCAAILWRDDAQAPVAAEALKLTAGSLLDLGIIDEVIPEPPGGAHRDMEAMTVAVKQVLLKYIRQLRSVSRKKLVEKRYEKFAKMGRASK